LLEISRKNLIKLSKSEKRDFISGIFLSHKAGHVGNNIDDQKTVQCKVAYGPNFVLKFFEIKVMKSPKGDE